MESSRVSLAQQRPRRQPQRLRVVPAEQADGGRPTPPESAGGRRVLVVDDERSIRLLCRVNLQLAGFEVIEAANGRDALAAISRETPDLVVLDVMMPDVDGWEVARRLAADAATSEIPIVFLSARAAQDDRRRGAELGAVDYVVKPFDPLALAERLGRTLERIDRGEREALRHELLEDDLRA